MKTRATIAREKNAPLVVENVELDAPGPGQVLIKLAASGICRSDFSVITGTIPHEFPVILGHEGAGVVAEVGPGVTGVSPGDAAMLSFVASCGQCRHCQTGRPNICTTHWNREPGAHPDGSRPVHQSGRRLHQMSCLGTMSEYTVVPEDAVIPVPADTPLESAALIGCGVMTGVGAVLNTAKVEAGSTVVVIGAGGVGVNVIQGAVLAGAAEIVAVDVLESKLTAARGFGATHTIDASVDDPVESVFEFTNGIGADYAFEVIGRSATIAQAFAMVGTGGAAVVVGVAAESDEVTLPARLFPEGERRLLGCMYGSSRMRVDMPRLLSLYRKGRLDLDGLITKRYTLEQINEAFDDLQAGKNIRGLLVFD